MLQAVEAIVGYDYRSLGGIAQAQEAVAGPLELLLVPLSRRRAAVRSARELPFRRCTAGKSRVRWLRPAEGGEEILARRSSRSAVRVVTERQGA
ncbi:hypothetical protein C2845_PM03G31050 [Panicum miliaceum]|uniref:Uncharacterized protein n=1 Tax=Panicum miliaceum TaxID=4540 RepID=A0A3L6TB08_PANMI|nr:hypothetical protein C2845_PM03G31050 [Panicum miliaceum]